MPHGKCDILLKSCWANKTENMLARCKTNKVGKVKVIVCLKLSIVNVLHTADRGQLAPSLEKNRQEY